MNKNKVATFVIWGLLLAVGLVFKFMPDFYFWQGRDLYKKQDFVKAHKVLQRAYSLNCHNKDIRYYYAKNLTNLTPTLTVQKAVFELSVSKQQDSAQQVAENQISIWRNNVLRKIGDNYIEQVPSDKGVLRWDENKFPLKISVKDNSGQEIPPYYLEEIAKAFEQWQASSGFITFTNEENPHSADIIVNIEPTPADMCSEKNCKYVVGFTTPSVKGESLKNMTITLYAKDAYNNFFSDKELYNTILHEIGHALGIMGHSYSTEDLMYMATDNSSGFFAPYRSSFQYLSQKDLNTIKLLYKLIPDICNTPINKLDIKGKIYAPIVLGTSDEISSRKVKEAKNYIKNAPELSGGYVDLGIAYAELHKYSSAKKAMKKALELAKSSDDKYLIYYNLAVINMNSNDLEEAMSNAEKAQLISENEDIKELITNIKHAQSANKKPFKIKTLGN